MRKNITYDDPPRGIYLKLQWISTASLLQQRVEELLLKMKKYGKLNKNRDYASALNVVLTGVEISGAYNDSQWIRIVSDREIYSGRLQRSPAHTKDIHETIVWLISHDYLCRVDGRRAYRPRGSNRTVQLPCAYVITEKWKTEISQKPLSVDGEIWRNPKHHFVQIRQKIDGRNGKKRTVCIQSLPKETVISATSTLLSEYDELIRTTSITLNGVALPSMLASTTRVFNRGSTAYGGRFYCALQNLPQNDRLSLRFNGDPVLEMDYTAMHPSILYHLAGSKLSEDPYLIKGFSRETVKIAFNVLLNRKKTAKGAIWQSISDNCQISESEAKNLEAAIKSHHKTITNWFCSDFGIKLQRIDSDIAFEVLRIFISHKRPIFFVHDSAVVSVRDAELLLLAMQESYSAKVEGRMGSALSLINPDRLKLSAEDRWITAQPLCIKVKSLEFNKQLVEAINNQLLGVSSELTQMRFRSE